MSGRESRKEKKKADKREERWEDGMRAREGKKIQKASDAQIIGHATGKAWCAFLSAVFNKSNWSQVLRKKRLSRKKGTPFLQFQYMCAFFFLLWVLLYYVMLYKTCASDRIMEFSSPCGKMWKGRGVNSGWSLAFLPSDNTRFLSNSRNHQQWLF